MIIDNNRDYRCSDAEMLTAGLVACSNFGTHKASIVLKNPGWADPFIANTETRIRNAMRDILGLDSRSTQRTATITLLSIQKSAHTSFSLLRTQIEAQFETDKVRGREILKTLGIIPLLSRATKSKKQETTLELLQTYSKGLSPAIRTELIAKGIPALSLDDLVTMATPFLNSNINQEKLKGDAIQITSDGVKELNAIFHIIMGICKVSAKTPGFSKVIQRKFSFNTIVKSLGGAGGTGENPDIPAA